MTIYTTVSGKYHQGGLVLHYLPKTRVPIIEVSVNEGGFSVVQCEDCELY